MDRTEHVGTRRFLAAAASARVRHAEMLVHGRLWRPLLSIGTPRNCSWGPINIHWMEIWEFPMECIPGAD
jgi:hypothetical protein